MLANLRAAIFCVSWPGDYRWLKYMLRSVDRFVTGAIDVVVVLEEDDALPVEALAELPSAHVCRCQRYRGTDYGGRGGQQIEKYRAFSYTDADRVVFVDSDTVFCRPTNLQTDPAINLQRPLVLHVPWDEIQPVWFTRDNGERFSGDPKMWRQPTEEVLGFASPSATMVRPPFCFPGWFLRELWEHVGGEARLRGWQHPVEFDSMGTFAMVRHLDAFTVVHANSPEAPAACVRQFWGGQDPEGPEISKELERLGLR